MEETVTTIIGDHKILHWAPRARIVLRTQEPQMNRQARLDAAIRTAQREISARFNITGEDILTIVPSVQDVRRHLGFTSKGALYEKPWRRIVEAAREEGKIQ